MFSFMFVFRSSSYSLHALICVFAAVDCGPICVGLSGPILGKFGIDVQHVGAVKALNAHRPLILLFPTVKTTGRHLSAFQGVAECLQIQDYQPTSRT